MLGRELAFLNFALNHKLSKPLSSIFVIKEGVFNLHKHRFLSIEYRTFIFSEGSSVKSETSFKGNVIKVMPDSSQ